MKNKRIFVRILAILLAILMAGSVLVSAISSLQASAAPSQSALNALKDEKEALEARQKEIDSKINSLEYEKSTALAKKEVLDEQIMLTQEDITNITAQIEEYTVLIAEKETEVVAAQQKQDEQWEKYQERIRTMEENGTISYYEVLFNATSFSDLLARIDFVSEIIQYDEALYQQFIAAKLATEAAKQDLIDTKAEQEARRADLLVDEQTLQTQVDEASALLAELENNIATYEDLYAEMDQEEADLQNQIDDMTEDLKNQEASGGSTVSCTGTYIWPSASSRLVTSLYGTRLHPIYKVYRTHYGIDIGAAYGTSILAADGGTVVTATYSSSYGNYVIINHGGGNTTLYAHMSKMSVSVGQNVTQGQVIGLVGSTGASTGPHIHFEIRINGSRVNPLDYYSNYTISSSAY